ncbi:MAG: hypothetical protein FJ098_15040, partial [Deltaproteobacteria bacterium]|nr:hypothetical protein [Deltaproteobacteria bacterium]
TWASIRWKDGAPVLDCDDPDESYGDRRCGGRFVVVEGVDVSDGEDESTEVGNDPFASLVLPGRAGEPDHLLVGSLRDGSVDLFTLSSSDGAPELVDRLVVTQGINDLAAHPSRTVFASAKYSASVLRVRVRTEAGRSTLEGLPPIALPLATTSSDIGRSLAFTGDGRRLLVAWRAPDGLMVLDTSGEGSTDGEIRFLGLVSLADDPSCVRIYPTAPGGEDRAWVTSLGNNSVYVVDPETLLVEARIRLGPSNVTPGFHGIAPFSLAWSPARREVYAAGFLGHAVSVIDADPDSASFHTVIEEIR